MMKELRSIVRRLEEGAGESVLATLVAVEGSSYRRPGARLLALSDGGRIGSISGGCLEEDVLARAARVARSGEAELARYDTTSENDVVWGVGLGCHGIVTVLIERLGNRPRWAERLAASFRERTSCRLGARWRGAPPLGTRLAEDFDRSSPGFAADTGIYWQNITPPPPLYIFGAGDDAQPLARLADELGWHVTVADPRSAYATAERFPWAARVLSGPADRLVALANPPPDAMAVVMSHHYVHDVPVLRELLARPAAYIGLLGPKERGERIVNDLSAAGGAFAPDAMARLHSPTGLDIGADGAEEVALSIIAEIRAVLAGRTGQPLRERDRPIHQ